MFLPSCFFGLDIELIWKMVRGVFLLLLFIAILGFLIPSGGYYEVVGLFLDPFLDPFLDAFLGVTFEGCVKPIVVPGRMILLGPIRLPSVFNTIPLA